MTKSKTNDDWLSKGEVQHVVPPVVKVPPFYGFRFKTVFSRPDPPMTYSEVRFPKFVLVFEISAFELHIDAITKSVGDGILTW